MELPDTDPTLRKVMYDVVGMAIATINEQSLVDEGFLTLFKNASNESDTAKVLVLSSYIEDKMKMVFELNLSELQSNKSKDALFGSNGPLSSFGARLQMAYHLGWISKKSYSGLGDLKKIRNQFAHQAYKTGFESKSIKTNLENLFVFIEDFAVPILEVAKNKEQYAKNRQLTDLSSGEKFILSVSILFLFTLRELALYPVSRKSGIEPSDIMKNRWGNEAPPFLNKLLEQGVEFLFYIVGPK